MLLKSKKRLGQNFLFDKNIQKKIADACQILPSDNVLEIGAGYGTLTELIARKEANVCALELDKNLCEILKDNLKGYPNVKILNSDILKFNLGDYFRDAQNKVKVIGNIPYYITTPIIEHLLKSRDSIDKIFLMVQKEFADRITAACGSKDYGSFSCFTQYYTFPKQLFTVKKTSFSPRPKVDSCFLALEVRQHPSVKADNEQFLFKIIRAAFNQRRKTLRNSLEGIIAEEKIETFLLKYKIDRNARPESLSPETFLELSNFANR